MMTPYGNIGSGLPMGGNKPDKDDISDGCLIVFLFIGILILLFVIIIDAL